MELFRQPPDSIEAIRIIEWPKTPSTKVPTIKLKAKETRGRQELDTNEEEQELPKNQLLVKSSPTKEDLISRPTTDTQNSIEKLYSGKSPTELPQERRFWNLGRLRSKSTPWPDPQLSTGTRCSKMGNRECWEAIGPAQGLFSQISQSIADLLDARVEEIEEGEPVAGNILTFGMYMIGRDQGTARPTLIFTCRAPKPRRRAIKFLKESGILKGYPKLLLAESLIVPTALDGNHLRLLGGTYQPLSGLMSKTSSPKRDATEIPKYARTPSPSRGLSVAAKVGIGVGVPVGFMFVVVIILFFWLTRRRRVIKGLLRELENSRGHSTFEPPRPVPEGGNSLDAKWLIGRPTNLGIPTATKEHTLITNHSSLLIDERRPHIAGAQSQQVHEMFDTPYVTVSPNQHKTPFTHPPPAFTMVDNHYNPSGIISNFEPGMIPLDTLQGRNTSNALSGDASIQQNRSWHYYLPPSRFTSNPAEYRMDFVEPSVAFKSDGALFPHRASKSDRDLCHLPSIGLEYSQDDVGEAPQEISPEAYQATSHSKGGTSSPLNYPMLYGRPITSGKRMKQATIGGIIYLNNLYCGLTVRHSFVEDENDTSSDNLGCVVAEVGDAGFLIDSDEEDVADVGISDAAATSQGSISSAASISRISSMTSGNHKSDSGNALPHVEFDSVNKGKTLNNLPVMKTLASPRQVASPFILSAPSGHDWALVELPELDVSSIIDVALKDDFLQGIVLPNHVAGMPITATEVVAVKGYSGISRGILSPSTTMMRLTPSSKFKKVLTVRFDDVLAKGDSGSWVLDALSGDLYGHIVAGIPESGLAYILPAQKTFQEIEELMGPVKFVSTLSSGRDL